MAAAVPPSELETTAINTPDHSPPRVSWSCHAGMCHLAERHRCGNYLAGTHVEPAELCIQAPLVASTPGVVAARSCWARGNLAAPPELHGVGPGIAKPRDGDAACRCARYPAAPAQCAAAGCRLCSGLARDGPCRAGAFTNSQCAR